MANKIDYKKLYNKLYLPKQEPSLVNVPTMNFIAMDGKGSPQNNEYQRAIQTLYSLTFTIKMSKMSGKQPHGYFEYVVPPLEGLWWTKDDKFDLSAKEDWLWTALIRQPEFVNSDVFNWALAECQKKKPELQLSSVQFITFTEGLCVQIMHIGAYEDEPHSFEKIDRFMEENGLVNDIGHSRKHHEIYLSDPRKTAPEKLKTVLRIPVKKV